MVEVGLKAGPFGGEKENEAKTKRAIFNPTHRGPFDPNRGRLSGKLYEYFKFKPFGDVDVRLCPTASG